MEWYRLLSLLQKIGKENKEVIQKTVELYSAVVKHLQTEDITKIFEYINNATKDRIDYETQEEPATTHNYCVFCGGFKPLNVKLYCEACEQECKENYIDGLCPVCEGACEYLDPESGTLEGCDTAKEKE